MKLNKFVLGMALAAAFSFSACGDDFEYTDEPSPVCENDAVRFSSANPTSIEADPSEPYFQIVVKRDAKAAASYNVAVVENQDGAFTVPATVAFAEGETEAVLPVQISANAPVATDLTLTLALAEDQVNPYKAEMGQFTTVVNIVKWNTLGEGEYYDGFWYEDFMGTVTIQQRDDHPEIYRFTNPYTDEVTGGGATFTPYITLTLAKNGALTWDKAFYVNTPYDEEHEVKAYLPSEATGDASNNASCKAIFDQEGNITLFQLDPYWYVDGLGGWGQGYACYVSFPGTDLHAMLGE